MNLSGLSQISKVTSGLRKPGSLSNQQLKLIFIYPILMADKIKAQTKTPIDSLIRDFISVTFLNEIFVQNTIQMVSTANQIRPLWDETGARVNPAGTLMNISAGQGMMGSGQIGIVVPNNNYAVDTAASDSIQRKIKEKTAVIQKLVKSDPKLARFRPYIEMITLGNMIDIPVVAGTQSFPVDTFALFHILIAAVSLKKPLTNMANLDFIVNELETLTPEKYFKLLNNLLPKQLTWAEKTMQYITGSKIYSAISRKGSSAVESMKQKFPTVGGPVTTYLSKRAQEKRIAAETPVQYNENPIFYALNVLKSKLDDTKLLFRFCLDQNFATSKFGISREMLGGEASISNTVLDTKLNSKLAQVNKIIISEYMKNVASLANIVTRSISNITIPTWSDVDYSQLRSIYIDNKLMDEIKNPLNSIMSTFSEIIPKSDVSSLKSLCDIDKDDVVKDLSELILHTAITSTSFSDSQYKVFMAGFDRASDLCRTFNKRFEKTISEVSSNIGDASNTKILAQLGIIKNSISDNLNNIFREYITEYIDNVGDPDKQPSLETMGLIREGNIQETIKVFIRDLVEVYYFLLLSLLQENLCKFIIVADVELETASNEVTTWPNYTLVIPIEIVAALHSAILSKSWKYLITDTSGKPLSREQIGQRSIFTPNDSYVKGIIKFVTGSLEIPNLIVVDSSKNSVYYKLMNSNEILKTNISTFETFVQSIVNKPLTGQSSDSYY